VINVLAELIFGCQATSDFYSACIGEEATLFATIFFDYFKSL